MRGDFQVKSGGLFPAGEKEKRALARMPEGTLMCVEFVRPRSQGRHRFFWAMVGWLTEQMDGDMWDKEMVAEAIKVLTGHCSTAVTPDGMIVRNTHSISFAKMGEDEFADFVSRAKDAAIKMVGVGLTEKDVDTAIDEFCQKWL